MTLSCGHEGAPAGEPLCIHLRTCREPWLDYYLWFSGSGRESVLACGPCAESGRPEEAGLACKACFELATTEVGNRVGVRGMPEFRVRDEPLDATVIETPIPKEIGTVVDMAPVASSWLLLTDGGAIVRFNAASGLCARLAVTTISTEADRKPSQRHALRRRVYASQDGAFAAVVNDYGHEGQIIDLRSGKVTVNLDGGDYYPDTVPFSFCFASVRGRTVAVHRTAWNRLDVTDPGTGELLTPRPSTSYQPPAPRPSNYLDYFHGALHLSPDGTRILDDGWVWHPVGVPVIWSLERWLTGNVWESENGVKRLCWRDYYWNAPVAWIGDGRVAIGGIGDDDNVMVPGARIFDPEGQEQIWFYGPDGIFFSDGAALYSSDETGLSRWDPGDGARTGRLPGFRPAHHHRAMNELVQCTGGMLLRWRIR